MTKFTRRQALQTGLSGAAFIAVGTGAAHAATGTSAPLNAKCSTMHPLIGQNLAMYCDDETVPQEAKNHALKIATCPHCNVGITPFGGAVNFARL